MGCRLASGVLWAGLLLVGAAGRAPAVWLRIRVMSTPERHEWTNQSAWQLPNHTATDVLRMISDIKPSVLERYFSGNANLSAPVPVSPGQPPMTVGTFLNQSAALGAHGCQIMPRLSLYEYGKGTLFETARRLLALPVAPRMTMLGLDNWANFASEYNQSTVRSVLEALRRQGWQRLAVNNVGGYHNALGLASIADFGTVVDAEGAAGAEPNWKQLSSLTKDKSVTDRLLYIDFKGEMIRFSQSSSPDQVAAALVDRIANLKLQEAKGYRFVYPIVQSFWDATALKTSDSGRFKGKSVYKVMCENIQQDVQERPAKQMPSCSLY